MSGHASQPLTGALVADADLVLAMTRTHVWGVLAFDPDAGSRTFLLPELCRLGRRIGARPPGDALRDWAVRVARQRGAGRLAGRPDERDR